MNQLFSSNQTGSNNQQPNKQEPYRFAVQTIPPVNNIIFSPISEQNYLMEGYIGQSYTSPAGSYYQPFSPLNCQPVYKTIEITTPIFWPTVPRPYSGFLPQPQVFDDSNMMKNGIQYEKIRPELINMDHGFRDYNKDTSNRLQAFLRDQIDANSQGPTITKPLASDQLSVLREPLVEPKVSLNEVPRLVLPGTLEEPEDDPSDQDFSTQGLSTSKEVGISTSHQFGPFIDVLYRIFSEGKIDEPCYNALSRFEHELLYFLVKRKYQPKAFRNSIDCSETPSFERLQKILQTTCNKRPEECYKFILTRVIKYLKRKLEPSCKTKANVEELLYEMYFKSTAEMIGAQLSDFHYPLTGALKGKFKLNSIYFAKVFKSAMFVDQVKTYCQSILIPEYSKDIMKKLNSLLARWSESLGKANGRSEAVEQEILEYVKFNKRCKLPWSVAEVQESIEKFMKLISAYDQVEKAD